MSADPDKAAACPIDVKAIGFAEGDPSHGLSKKNRSVHFPSDNQLVTQYFEAANPWHEVPTTSRAQLAQDYLLSCRRHNTPPIDSVLHQIRELPENAIGGGTRAARLSLADCSLEGAAPADALEALLRKVQFHRLELDHAEVDDEGAEALFDMIEYYESACVVSITGPRQFGIRGWQAASRMIKKSAELSEIEVAESTLEPSHAPVLARALRPHTCRLRALCLQRATLSGEALMCLVIALKSNGSIRELRLPDNSLTPHDAQQLASLLRFNTNIQLLDLSNNLIQDMGVGHIADALVEQAAQTPPSTATSPMSPQLYPLSGLDSRGLAFLVLWNNQLTRNCAAHLSKALRSSHSLCVLNIGRNALGTDAIRALSTSGGGHGASLLSLGLQCARLGPDAGAPLADLLTAPDTKLQRLDLRDNRLGTAGLQAILNAMKDNHTLTQLDLDDPAESSTLSEDGTAATVARLTRDIRALCRRNEPPASEPERRVHRKISLTCHTACVVKSSVSSRGRCRLRSPLPSPAPSPAGSPVPHHQNVQPNRFSVTRVTPERESSTESSSPTTPTRPTYCSTPSRFKVMQVAEPPSIQVYPAHKRTSRFSVTRNYDSIYNPSPRESPSPSPTPTSPSPSISPCPSDASYSDRVETVEITRVPAVLATVACDSPSEVSRVQSPRDASEVVSVRSSDNPKDSLEIYRVPQSASEHTLKSTGVESVQCFSDCDSPKGSREISKVPSTQSSGYIDSPSESVGSRVSSTSQFSDYSDNPNQMEFRVPTFESSDSDVQSDDVNIDGCNVGNFDVKTSVSTLYEAPYRLTDVTTSVASSSIDNIHRYDYPSITTLSGALFSRSVSEMSNTARPKVQKSIDSVPSESNERTNSIPILTSRSEPIFGPVLFVESLVPPTVVPNSRFSICPSPVSFISADSKELSQNIRITDISEITSSNKETNRSHTSIRRDVVSDEIVPTDMTSDIRASIDVPSYTGQAEASSKQTKELTTQNKDNNETRTKEVLTEDTELTKKAAEFKQINKELISVSEVKIDKQPEAPNAHETVKIDKENTKTVIPTEKTGSETGQFEHKNKDFIPISELKLDTQSTNVTNARKTVDEKQGIENAQKNVSKLQNIPATSDFASNVIEANIPSERGIIKEIDKCDVVSIDDVKIIERSIKEIDIRDVVSKESIKEVDKHDVVSKENTKEFDKRDHVSKEMEISDVVSKDSIKEIHTSEVVSKESIKEIDKRDVVSKEIIKEIDKLDVISKESIKEVDKLDVISIESIKDVDKRDVVSIESIKEVDKRNVISQESIKEVDKRDVVSIESIKEVDKRDVSKESIKEIHKSDVVSKESKKEIDKRDIVSIESIKEVDKRDVVSKEIIKEVDKRDVSKKSIKEIHKSDVVSKKSKKEIDKRDVSKEIKKEVDKRDVSKETMKEIDTRDVVSKESIKEIDKRDVVSKESMKEIEKRDIVHVSKESIKELDKSDIVSKDKEIERLEILSKDKKGIEKVSSGVKAVDFAREPQNVIFFISDEPVSLSDIGISISDNIDARISDTKDFKSDNKTYSDVLKTEPQNKTELYEQIDESVKTNKLVYSVEVSDSDNADVKVDPKDNAAKVHSDKDFVNIDDILIRKDDKAMKKIEAITEDLGNLIQEMKDISSKSKKKCTVEIGSLNTNIVPGNNNRDVVLKKNKSESSLDSPDLEVSRLMTKKIGSPFRDSSSSLEISGDSMESLNAIENAPKQIIIKKSEPTELDRRKDALSAESSVESSDVTPVNHFLNTSVSSNESVSPIIFQKKIHGSLSSLEASVSSLDSKQDRVMVTSADSGIEHSLQNPSDNKEDASSNEGTLTHNSSLRETVKRTDLQETLTSSPKRTSSLLDVPALKSKGLERMRKISWVAPSPSFHIPKEPEKVKEEKPSHLEKLLSLFQHPTSLFSRSQSDDERKSASNTPPRKDSSLTSSFWSWGSAENYKEEKEDTSEADSTLSERVQVSFVDESFSKKLDSKTPSTDTDNTLSEFQSVVTETTDVLVQKLDLSRDNAGNSDTIDLSKPNDLSNVIDAPDKVKLDEGEVELVRPRSFAAVLKASGSENSLEKQPSPDLGQLVDKLPVKVIRGIKENISPENTLTSSVTNTQALAMEMTAKNPAANPLWEVPLLEKSEPKTEELKSDLAPIATIDETCDIAADNFSSDTIQLAFIDDMKVDIDVRTSDDQIVPTHNITQETDSIAKALENVDLGKDALSYLMYESQDFEPGAEHAVTEKIEGSLAQELKEAAIKEMIDLSPELVIDEAIEVFPKDITVSPIIPDRAKIKKSNSLEDLSQRQEKDEKSPKTKTIAFKVPETSPRDIPERPKLRSRSGSSPKSLPESLNKPCPLTKMDSILSKKKKKVSSLGKMARDSLLALNMSEEEIAEFRRSYKLTSVESLRSLESVSEDANSQSGTSFDSRCRACLRTSQESLMSLDSITEDCKCADRDKPRSMR